MRNYYKHGEWNCICDVCGFEYKSTELRKDWRGLMVCDRDFETRHPSDLIKAPRGESTIPWSRPEPADSFVTLVEAILTEDGEAILDNLEIILLTET